MRTARLLLLPALALAASCDRAPPVETDPVAVTPPRVRYPEEQWDAGVEGRTVLRILVDTAGGVDSARVESPSGEAAFDSAALAAAAELRFRPALRDGTPVPRWVLLPVEFALQPSAAPSDGPAPDTGTSR